MAERLLIANYPPVKIGGRDRINMRPAEDLFMGFAIEFGLAMRTGKNPPFSKKCHRTQLGCFSFKPMRQARILRL